MYSWRNDVLSSINTSRHSIFIQHTHASNERSRFPSHSNNKAVFEISLRDCGPQDILSQEWPTDVSVYRCCLKRGQSGDKDTLISTKSYVVFVKYQQIYQNSKRQTFIALSSGEDEYVVRSKCARDVSWICKILWEIIYKKKQIEDTAFPATLMKVESAEAIELELSSATSSRTKNIRRKHHHVREIVLHGILRTERFSSSQKPAALLTKILTIQTPSWVNNRWRIVYKIGDSIRQSSVDF